MIYIPLNAISYALYAVGAPVLLLCLIAIRLSIVNRRLRDQRDLAVARWNATRQREQRLPRLEKELAPFTVEMQAAAVRYDDDETRLDYRPQPEFERDMADLTAEIRRPS